MGGNRICCLVVVVVVGEASHRLIRELVVDGSHLVVVCVFVGLVGKSQILVVDGSLVVVKVEELLEVPR